MKNRRWLNILTSLVAVMFILGLFYGAAALSPAEQYQKAKEQYSVNKDKYEGTKEHFQKAKEQFENALQKLNNSNASQSKDDLKLKFKDYLEKAIDQIIAHLQVLKSRVELSENKGVIPFDASANIDAHIVQMESLKLKVQQANTTQELRDAHKELKDSWIKIRLETQYCFEILLNDRINKFVAKADNVSEKLDAAIANRKASGMNTAKLEDASEKYNNMLKYIKEKQQATNDLFSTHNGFSSNGTVTDNKNAEAFLRQADNLQKDIIKKLKSASQKLIEFVKDFRKMSGGKVKVNIDKSEDGSKIKIEGTITSTLSGN